ncbi:MAG: PKD domain-containing protein [Bacteroides sp.]|nr:PKD domain-containing protein [Bacteroides sp.]
MRLHTNLLVIVALLVLISSACKKEDPNDPNDPDDPNAPHACFVTPADISAGIAAVFNYSCTENATSFSWNFGDGGTSSDEHPMHTYMDGGSFDVVLTVSDDDGNTDQMKITITALAPEFFEHSGRITSDETWIEGIHYIISDVILDGATITIEPGAIINFNSGRSFYIGYQSSNSGATLIANGTADKMITFTSSAATKSAGDWNYIWFDDGASKISSMQYCSLEYGGGKSDDYGTIHIRESAVSMSNCMIKLSESHGISLDGDGYFEAFNNNLVEQNGLSAISIEANYAHTIGEGNTLISEKGIIIKGSKLEMGDVTWLKQSATYVIESNLYVGSSSGTSLTLAPGVEISMGLGRAIYFGQNSTFGTLNAVGTAQDRIRITSNAQDGAKSAGDWDYIYFSTGAGTSSRMAYCDIEFGGGYSPSYGMIYLSGSGLSITNSTISNSETEGISMKGEAAFTECSDNVFEDNTGFPIKIYGNYAHTIGRGNSFNTASGILVAGDHIEQADITWLNHEVPYIIGGDMDLGSSTGSKLTIEPGTTVKFSSGSWFRVGAATGAFGSLVADGDPENMITFSSAAPEGFGAAGDWDGIWFASGTGNNSILNYCNITDGGGYTSSSGNLIIQNKAAGVPVISNCQISNSAAWGIYLKSGSDPALTDNNFENNALGDINEP